MKTKGAILEYTKARNNDILRAYRAELSEASVIHMPDIFQRLANRPAQRFWVSEERAMAIVSAQLNGRPHKKIRPTKSEMFEEIKRRALLRCPRSEKKCALPSCFCWRSGNDCLVRKCLSSILRDVIQEPAPKFYMTPRTIGAIIYKIRG